MEEMTTISTKEFKAIIEDLEFYRHKANILGSRLDAVRDLIDAEADKQLYSKNEYALLRTLDIDRVAVAIGMDWFDYLDNWTENREARKALREGLDDEK